MHIQPSLGRIAKMCFLEATPFFVIATPSGKSEAHKSDWTPEGAPRPCFIDHENH